MLSLLLVFCFAAILTGIIRSYAIHASIIDIPNERSSHQHPTPRGGGLSFVITSILAFIAASILTGLSWNITLAASLGGAVVALVGFWDDRGHVNAKWRLLAHFITAAIGLFFLGPIPSFDLFGSTVHLGFAGYILGAFTIVWLINLSNFMDGIDGLAGSEATISAYGTAGLLLWLNAPSTQWLPPLLFGTAVLGFLVWNFPPAKIFMGDAGSGFLGFIISLLMLWNAHSDQKFLWIWLILMGVFIVDSTFTLIRRLLNKERIYEAHRSHAYQQAARQIGRHRPVTLTVAAINLFWLLPLAGLVGASLLSGATALLIAYIPLLLLALRFKAGQRDQT